MAEVELAERFAILDRKLCAKGRVCRNDIEMTDILYP